MKAGKAMGWFHEPPPFQRFLLEQRARECTVELMRLTGKPPNPAHGIALLGGLATAFTALAVTSSTVFVLPASIAGLAATAVVARVWMDRWNRPLGSGKGRVVGLAAFRRRAWRP